MTTDAERLDLIDDYLKGSLDEEQLDSFETELLFNEALQNEVATQKALKAGLAAESTALLKVEPPSLLRRVDSVVRSRGWAYAASVLVLVGSVTLVQPTGDTVPTGIAQMDLVYVERVRAGSEPELILNSGKPHLLSIDAIEFENTSVNVAVTSSTGEVSVEGEGLTPSEDGVLNLAVPPLGPGQYELSLRDTNTQTVYALSVK